MCCLKPTDTTSLTPGPDHTAFENPTCSGSLKLNAPLLSRPPSTDSVASPAVDVTVAEVHRVLHVVLPMPAAPSTSTTHDQAARTAASSAERSPIARLRPTKGTVRRDVIRIAG